MRNISSDLLKAYLHARYIIMFEQQEYCIRVGQRYTWLDRMMSLNNYHNGIFITAYNPGSQRQSEQLNQQNQQGLISQLVTDNISFIYGYSSDDEGLWPIEQSLLVFNLTDDSANLYAQAYQQTAYLKIITNQPVKLVLVD